MSSCSALPGGATANPNVNCVLQSCATVSGNPVLTGGSANCSYLSPSSGLEPCSSLGGSANPGVNCNPLGLIPCSALPASNRNPRINCADLIDLPLYSDLPNGTAYSGKNSVVECSTITNPNPAAVPALIVGVDYAVHNRDCIRFCDNPEAGITANNGVNCTTRKCNQVVSPNIPVSTTSGANCSNTNCCLMQNCNLLTQNELNQTKFQSDTYKYCNGDGIKCYNFTQDKLPYLIPRANNTMCVLHNCPPPSVSASCASDDTLNITNQGTSYTNDYARYICNNIGSTAIGSIDQMCNPIVCLPVVERPYRCSPTTNVDPPPTIPNPLCDKTGPYSTCDDTGFCYLTIDCNVDPTEPECASANDAAQPSVVDDVTDAWFYRPVPMSKATDGNGNIRSHMEVLTPPNGTTDDLCYSKSDMKYYNWGWDGKIDMGLFTINLGYFHSEVLPDHSRSPGMCGVSRIGNRGTGNLYLCKTHALVYHSPDPKGVYMVNYGRANYESSDPEYYIRVCTRYKNTLAIDDNTDTAACGKRECAISCGFGWCSSQECGFDKCVDLAVSDSNPTECAMNHSLFSGNPSKKCLGTIDDGSQYGGVRIRAIKYDDRVCAFFDIRGLLAYNQLPYSIDGSHFFTGGETLDDGTCVSGSKDANGNCTGGFDTTSSQGITSVWRTIFTVNYIGDILSGPTGGQKKGYYDKSGQYYPAQQCAKIPLRIGPPRQYNLANSSNSSKLFTPPIMITNVSVKRGGVFVNPTGNDAYGTTDFFYPEIQVGFGPTRQLLSLGAGYTGYETGGNAENDYPSSPVSSTITTTVNSLTYTADIFVRKEYNPQNFAPLFCLYQKINDINGSPLAPAQIACVNRNYPPINNYLLRQANSSLPISRMVLSLDPASVFDNSTMDINYMIGAGSNNTDQNCTNDDNCSPSVGQTPIKLAGTLDSACNYGIGKIPQESYPLCTQRDFCSQLNVECVDNEVSYYNAEHDGVTTDFTNYINIRNNCNNNILPSCNTRSGISSNNGATIYNPNPNGVTPDPQAYGWFNEICIVLGFQSQLRTIVAYNPSYGMGKCIIDPASPYLTDSDPNTNCDAGGNAPNCICLTYDPIGNNVDVNQISRLETPHEAGLCVNIPLPQTCPAITYNLTPNTDISDPDYVNQSIINSFGDSNCYNKNNSNTQSYYTGCGVDLSHEYRSFGKSSPNPITLKGHADFPIAFPGMSNVIGTCKGFWQNVNINNVSTAPRLSCISNNGQAQWSDPVTNPCVRYSCQSIATAGPNDQGIYQGNYDNVDNGEDIGTIHGFATWPGYTKTNDFPQTVTADACIYGFKPNGSSAVTNGDGTITGYSGGTLPTRLCDQIGNWHAPFVTNYCQRISCPIVNPSIPTSINDVADWQAWYNSGGATFPAVNASRSNVRIQSDNNSNSYATGTCNNSLGFFQAPGGSPPTRGCDYLGNWQTVQNPCVTQCDAVDEIAGNNSNNGYATWAAVNNLSLGSSAPGVFLGCIAGYVVSGYTGTPTRTCDSVNVQGGAVANLWSVVQNSCINQCQGGANDPTHGITTHPTLNGNISITWPDTDFGQYAYISDIANLDASHFQQGRSNNHYLLSRYCNADGTWSDPQILCAANNGQVGNATYNATGNPVPSNTNSKAVNGATLTGTCIAGYWNSNKNNNPPPSRQCMYADANNNIDQAYWGLAGGTSDCELIQCSMPVGTNTFGNAQYVVPQGSCNLWNYRITCCIWGCSSDNYTLNGSNDPCAPGWNPFNFPCSCTSNCTQYDDNTQYFTTNTTINLSCQGGYGKGVINGSSRNINSGETDVCGSPSTVQLESDGVWDHNNGFWQNTYTQNIVTDRNPAPPSLTCQSNGTWTSIANDCSSCRDCSGSQPQKGGLYCPHDGIDSTFSYGACCMHNDSGFKTLCTKNTAGCDWSTSLPSLSNLSTVINVAIDQGSSGDRYHGRYDAICYDGTYYVTRASCSD